MNHKIQLRYKIFYFRHSLHMTKTNHYLLKLRITGSGGGGGGSDLQIRAGQWVTNLGTVGNRYDFEFSIC